MSTRINKTTMTDLTPIFNSLLTKQGAPLHKPRSTPDEFLKEAYRIVSDQIHPQSKSNNTQNSHITSLLQYLHSIRHSYLSTSQRHTTTQNATPTQHLTDPERDAVDTSTAILLRDLATSIANLSSAESLRQETATTLLHKKYGHSAAGAALRRWAGDSDSKSPDHLRADETARATATVRESVLWFLRHGLEGAAGAQRGMVEKRIERVREKEKSVLYKSAGKRKASVSRGVRLDAPGAAVMSESDTALIEAELSPEQLQIFAEENNSMLKHYEDTLGQVQ